MMHAAHRISSGITGLLPAECVRGAARIGASFEHTAIRIHSYRTHGAGAPFHLRPPSDVVPTPSEFLTGTTRDAALEIQAASMIRMRLGRRRKTVRSESRRFDRALHIHAEHVDV